MGNLERQGEILAIFLGEPGQRSYAFKRWSENGLLTYLISSQCTKKTTNEDSETEREIASPFKRKRRLYGEITQYAEQWSSLKSTFG